jgi:hypothetical protein
MADLQFWTLLGFLCAMFWWLTWQISEKLDRVIELLEQIGTEMQKEEDASWPAPRCVAQIVGRYLGAIAPVGCCRLNRAYVGLSWGARSAPIVQ